MNLGLRMAGVDPIGLGCRPENFFAANSGPIWPAGVPLTLEAVKGFGCQHHVCVVSPKGNIVLEECYHLHEGRLLVKYSDAVSKFQKRPF